MGSYEDTSNSPKTIRYFAPYVNLISMRRSRRILNHAEKMMFTYQARPRIFRHKTGESLDFPNDCRITFYLRPKQPFGEEPGGGRTIVQNADASFYFNANSGEFTSTSKSPLTPLDVTICEPKRTIILDGTVLKIDQHFETLKDLEEMINSIYFLLPMLLNVVYGDPPYIERVEGLVGQSSFRWELLYWHGHSTITTQDKQEERFIETWLRMSKVAEPKRRRLAAALHYFHTACRLARMGSTPGEFVAEILLNLSKTLEVLFPPNGDGKTREAVRFGLRQLGYEKQEIERNFIPAMALRNEIDVGHVELALFKLDQLKTIHSYSERAEEAFRYMFQRLFERIDSGEYDVTEHQLSPPRSSAIQIIEKLKSYETEDKPRDTE